MCPPGCLEALYGRASRRGLVKSGLIAAAAVACSTHGVVAAVSEAPVATGCPTILDQVPAKGAYLLVGGPKVMGGTGGPSRVIAMF